MASIVRYNKTHEENGVYNHCNGRVINVDSNCKIPTDNDNDQTIGKKCKKLPNYVKFCIILTLFGSLFFIICASNWIGSQLFTSSQKNETNISLDLSTISILSISSTDASLTTTTTITEEILMTTNSSVSTTTSTSSTLLIKDENTSLTTTEAISNSSVSTTISTSSTSLMKEYDTSLTTEETLITTNSSILMEEDDMPLTTATL